MQTVILRDQVEHSKKKVHTWSSWSYVGLSQSAALYSAAFWFPLTGLKRLKPTPARQWHCAQSEFCQYTVESWVSFTESWPSQSYWTAFSSLLTYHQSLTLKQFWAEWAQNPAATLQKSPGSRSQKSRTYYKSKWGATIGSRYVQVLRAGNSFACILRLVCARSSESHLQQRGSAQSVLSSVSTSFHFISCVFVLFYYTELSKLF